MKKPEIDEWLLWVWRAWNRLSPDRPWYGGGMGPAMPASIPWTSLITWCEFNNYNREEITFLDICFRSMDEVFITHFKRKAEMKK